MCPQPLKTRQSPKGPAAWVRLPCRAPRGPSQEPRGAPNPVSTLSIPPFLPHCYCPTASRLLAPLLGRLAHLTPSWASAPALQLPDF